MLEEYQLGINDSHKVLRALHFNYAFVILYKEGIYGEITSKRLLQRNFQEESENVWI